MMRSLLPVLAVLVPCVALAAANPADLQKKARARMKSLDFEAALPLLEQVRDLPGLEPSLRAQALVDLGITFVNLGRADDARKAFDEALEASPGVPFPAGVPPKIRRLFDEVKDARLQRLAPAPEPAPPPKVAEPVAPPLPIAAPPAAVVLAPPPVSEAKPRLVLVPTVLVGAGVLTVGAGVGTAFASQNADRKLAGALHSSAEAQRLLGNRTTYGLAAVVCYAAGAALIATGAAVFAFTGSSAGAQVSAAVTPSSAAVTVGGTF